MRNIILTFSVIGGMAAAILGPLLAVALAAISLLGPRAGRAPVVSTASMALGVAAVGVGLGLPLAWAGWRALQGRPSRILRLPRWWGWLLIFLGVLIFGQAAAITGPAAALMPLLQVAAGALPPLIFLAWAFDAAGRQASQITRRPALGSLAWGGLGGAGLGLIGELLLIVGVVVVAMVVLSITDPELTARLQTIVTQIGRTGRGLGMSKLAQLASSPVVVIAALTLLGVLAPALEEVAKALAVPLVAGTGRRLTRLDGFLFGVAAGAGFAIVEGILNGTLALRMSGSWAGLMAFRGSAAAMHCLASGLMGLGWQAILVERRWLRGIGLGLLAVLLHGAWNMSAGIISLNSLQAASTGGLGDMARMGVTGLLVMFMAVLWLAVVGGLALIPRRLAIREATQSEIVAIVQ
jgi:RsiW-degrading membrane proteinase PrsW (M82 family)